MNSLEVVGRQAVQVNTYESRLPGVSHPTLLESSDDKNTGDEKQSCTENIQTLNRLLGEDALGVRPVLDWSVVKWKSVGHGENQREGSQSGRGYTAKYHGQSDND